MVEEREKKLKREVTDATILDTIGDNNRAAVVPMRGKSKSGIVVKGIHDLAVRFSKCCNPVPGDEIVGFVTRGRGVTIHRTDCNQCAEPAGNGEEQADRCRMAGGGG